MNGQCPIQYDDATTTSLRREHGLGLTLLPASFRFSQALSKIKHVMAAQISFGEPNESTHVASSIKVLSLQVNHGNRHPEPQHPQTTVCMTICW
jgi:hypothetical protein